MEILMKDTVDLSEEEILKIRLVSTQKQLVSVSIENLELKKQLLLLDKKLMEDNFLDIQKEVSEEHEINYSDYLIDFSQKKLVRKK